MNLIYGLSSSFLIWIFLIYINFQWEIPLIKIPNFLWRMLFGFFFIDFCSTIIWSLLHLPPHKQDKELITSGPYNWTRHPIYASFIWSATGLVTLIFSSWLVMISVIPVSLIWSWIVMKEESSLYIIFGQKYKKYSSKTGLFFPKFDK